jgi:GNAT superfamily N-acetyltransferase
MVNAVTDVDVVRHAGYEPGGFPARWHDAAYTLHRRAWPSAWEGQLSRDRFLAELGSDHVDVLYGPGDGGDALLAYVKWKATADFYLSRDELSDPAERSLPSSPPARYVCAYEITAAADRAYRGLGRRLLSETLEGWQRAYGDAVFCTYSPKRKLTATLRRLAEANQDGRGALELFAHRASAAAARRMDRWTAQLGQSLEAFLRREILPVPDEQIMPHLIALSERYGREVVEGVVAAIGIAYNFVFHAGTGQLACGPAAFHRALGAEHWRQYPASAANCADALGLVDHWRYSRDPARRETCARFFNEQRARRAQPSADRDQLVVLA